MDAVIRAGTMVLGLKPMIDRSSYFYFVFGVYTMKRNKIEITIF